MDKAVATPEEVCRNVANYFRYKGITHDDIGKVLGKSRSYISNVLSSKKRFSKQMAYKFSRAYGLNVGYLLFGEGDMIGSQTLHDIAEIPTYAGGKDRDTFVLLSSLMECAEGILHVINDKDALDAWYALANGDFDMYISAMQNMKAKYHRVSNPILARYVCDHVGNKMYVPIITEVDRDIKVSED